MCRDGFGKETRSTINYRLAVRQPAEGDVASTVPSWGRLMTADGHSELSKLAEHRKY